MRTDPLVDLLDAALPLLEEDRTFNGHELLNEFVRDCSKVVTEDQGTDRNTVDNVSKDQDVDRVTDTCPLIELSKRDHDRLVRDEHTE